MCDLIELHAKIDMHSTIDGQERHAGLQTLPRSILKEVHRRLQGVVLFHLRLHRKLHVVIRVVVNNEAYIYSAAYYASVPPRCTHTARRLIA